LAADASERERDSEGGREGGGGEGGRERDPWSKGTRAAKETKRSSELGSGRQRVNQSKCQGKKVIVLLMM